MKTFNELREELYQLDENLGTLAAKHYLHSAEAEYGEREHAHKAATATLNRIRKNHGAAAAKAVEKHSSAVSDHDNGLVSSGKSAHREFVKKHLGGAGSSDHKAYLAHLKKKNYSSGGEGYLHHEGIREELYQLEENLGTLAAKHYLHSAEAEYGENEHAHKAATATLNRIKQNHGAAAAKAVEKHSSAASEHDNGLTRSGKSDHKNFVKKHLGGVGSSDHKAYLAHLKKKNYSSGGEGILHHE